MASTYYPILYQTCEYMINHMDDYKEESINFVLKEVVSTFVRRKTGFYTSITLDESAINLHNRLMTMYELLLGKGNIQSKKSVLLGYDIRPNLKFDNLSRQTIAYMLCIVYRFTVVEQENDFEKVKRKRLRQEVFSINIDKSKDSMNYLIEKINGGKIKDIVETGAEEREPYKILDEVFNLYRQTLLLNRPKEDERLQYYYENLLGDNSHEAMRIIRKDYPQFGRLEPFYYLWLYIDLCCHYMIQKVIKFLWNNTEEVEIKKEKVNKLIEIISSWHERILDEDKSVIINSKEKDVEMLMFEILSFNFIKDKFLEDTKVLKFIDENCMEAKNPSEEYSLFSDVIKVKNNPDAVRKWFAEDVNVKRTTFDEQCKYIMLGIHKLNVKSMGYIPQNLTGIRAVYREIYLDGIKYNRKTAKYIFNEFVMTDKIEISDYYYIKEKINRGIYRENGKMEEYKLKNEFQYQLYDLVTFVLAKVDLDKISNSFQKVLDEIVSELKEE